MKNRQDLKKLFINGAKPSEKDFEELIDSSFNKLDEPRQEVVSNAGWYYFRFFPLFIRPNTFSHSSLNDQVFLGSAAANRISIGVMNINIPRGISRINRLKVVGTFVLQAGTETLQISLFKAAQSTSLLEQIYSGNVSSSFNNPRNISDILLNVRRSINPNEDALSVTVAQHLKRSDSMITIHSIGIEFS